MQKYEALSTSKPDEAKVALKEAKMLLGELRSLKTDDKGKKIEDLNRIRNFYQCSINFEKAHPIFIGNTYSEAQSQEVWDLQKDLKGVDNDMRTVRDSLRDSLNLAPGAKPTKEQLANARLALKADTILKDNLDLPQVLEKWNALVEQAPPDVLSKEARLDQQGQIFGAWMQVRDASMGG